MLEAVLYGGKGKKRSNPDFVFLAADTPEEMASIVEAEVLKRNWTWSHYDAEAAIPSSTLHGPSTLRE